MKTELRTLLSATPFRPFVIVLANGQTYRVHHPDFIFVAPRTISTVCLYDEEENMHLLSTNLIVELRVLGSADPARA